jgi:RNA polymerase sigma-70 factor (ECF subfamily)
MSGRTPTSGRLLTAFPACHPGAPDAAGAAQDAFTAAWRELPRLRDPRGFDAWFDRILVNACRMQVRRHPAHGRAVGDEALARLRTAAGSPTLDEAAVLDILDDGFELLDADDRAMLALWLVGARSVSDIGLVLHLPVGTVKWRLHEARRVLGSVLERA